MVKRKICYGIVQPGQSVTDGIPVIKVNNLISGLKSLSELDTTTRENEAKYIRTRLHGGELIISVVGTIGKTALVPKSFAGCNLVRATALIDIEDALLSKWVKYYIDSPYGQSYIEQNLNTTVQPTLNIKSLEKMSIPLYDTEYMEKIVLLLSSLDEKIAINRAINDNLEKQAALLFDENYSNNDYDISPLEAIATIKYGKGLPTKYLTFQGYPVFGGNGVIGSYTYFMYKEPQVLVSCRGAASGNIMESYPNSFITNNSLVLEWNDYRYYEFYKQFLFANPLYSYATGSAQPQITIENIRNVPVPFPDYDEISDLCSILRSISVLHYENIVENNKLVTLRDTLLPRLMSGEIDVSAINL